MDRLKKDIARLEKENRRLRQRLAEYEGQKAKKFHQADPGDSLRKSLWLVKNNRRRFSQNNWFSFVYNAVNESTFFGIVHRIISWVKKFAVFTSLWAIINVIFTVISASAVYLLFLAVLILMLPFAVAGAIVALIQTALSFKRHVDFFEKTLKNKKAVLFFPMRSDDMRRGSQFSKSVASATKKKYVAIIVSPYFFSSLGLLGKHPYATCRNDGKNVYIMRRRFYFFFKRKFVNDKNYDFTLVF